MRICIRSCSNNEVMNIPAAGNRMPFSEDDASPGSLGQGEEDEEAVVSW